MTVDSTAALYRYIEQRVDEYMRDLTRLCNQPSVAAEGLGMRECAALVAGMLSSRGVAAQVIETAGSPVVVGTYGSGERGILLYNHYDVQPPEPLELWDSPPFQATLRDGKLFARGVNDDKGEFISRLAAFDAVRAVYGEPPCRVTFLVEGEEEIGSQNLEAFIREHRELLTADACVWEAGGVDFEGRPEMYLGLRGFAGVELRVRTINDDAHSGVYSYLPSAAWRLVWALSTLKDRAERILIPGIYDDVQPPTPRQHELLASMPSREDEDKAHYGITRFAGNLSGQPLKEAVFLPTCNIQGMWSGYQGEGIKNVIPADAGCKIDFRLPPNVDPHDVVRKLRAHLRAQGFDDVEVIEWAAHERGAVIDPDDPYIQLAMRTARDVYGKEPVVSPLIGGSGPFAIVLEQLRLPIIVSGVSYPDHHGHAPNENLRLSDWVQGTKHMARILAEFNNA